MWELDCEESWVLKNWCFWAVVLEKTLESPLDCKEIKPVNPNGNQPWTFIERSDANAEVPVLWPPDTKRQPIGKDLDAGKDWGKEEKVATGVEVVGWHHWLSGHEFEQVLRVGDGCCSPWGRRVGHDWTTAIDLCVSFRCSTMLTWLLWLCSKSEVREHDSCISVLCKDCFGYAGSFVFP